MMKKLPKRRSPRLKNFDYSSPHIYFITSCTINKITIFTDKLLNGEIVDCIRVNKIDFDFKVFCYCLMPDHLHLHLLLAPARNGTTVSQFMNAFKSKSTRICWNHGIHGKVWQGRFYDHILRKSGDIKTVAEYILHNPVRNGLVKDWRDYEYCGLLDAPEI